MTEADKTVLRQPEVSTDAKRGSVDWLIAQLNNKDEVDMLVAEVLTTQRARIDELEQAVRLSCNLALPIMDRMLILRAALNKEGDG